MAPYVLMNSGARVNVEEGCPTVQDVAQACCRHPMFSGQTDLPWSVAHHCVCAAQLAFMHHGPEIALYTLLHEAEVSVSGEIPGPVKTAEQRTHEQIYRKRIILEHYGVLPSAAQWDRVEFFDKVEQAASVNWLGFKETVHARVWEAANEELREEAIALTKSTYDNYPPWKQLFKGSVLSLQFVKLYNKYRGKSNV